MEHPADNSVVFLIKKPSSLTLSQCILGSSVFEKANASPAPSISCKLLEAVSRQPSIITLSERLVSIPDSLESYRSWFNVCAFRGFIPCKSGLHLQYKRYTTLWLQRPQNLGVWGCEETQEVFWSFPSAPEETAIIYIRQEKDSTNSSLSFLVAQLPFLFDGLSSNVCLNLPLCNSCLVLFIPSTIDRNSK